MLKWKPHQLDGGSLVITECCGIVEPARAIIAHVPKRDQKRGQPPFRRRCTACGPTQSNHPGPRS